MLEALIRAVTAFVQAMWRVARQLFHEVTGAFFVLFTVIGGAAAWREWKQGAADWKIAVAAGFAVMMAMFAVSAFRRSWRLGRKTESKTQ